jgi:alpha-L-fucosidase
MCGFRTISVATVGALMLYAGGVGHAEGESSSGPKAEPGFRAWRSPVRGWLIVGSASVSDGPDRITVTPGHGVITNGLHGRAAPLVTDNEYGDATVQVELLLTKGAKAVLLLQGRYRITFEEGGAKGDGKAANGGGGVAAAAKVLPAERLNDAITVPAPAGKWTALEIEVRAPRFDKHGNKTENARLVRVTRDGTVIAENVDFYGPGPMALYADEAPHGPVALLGDSGPIAYRNLRLRDTVQAASQRASELVRPTPAQAAWQDLEMGMLIHFGLNTYHDVEWSDGTLLPESFNPTELDCNQWVQAAKSAGAQYIVFVAKHHDGFCLWPTETTNYSVQRSPWRRGRPRADRDVVGELARACRAAGMKLGLYLSPWDRHEATYDDVRAYEQVFTRQLTELVTRYGPLVEVWFDGAGSKGRQYNWGFILPVVREYQPQAMIFNLGEPTIRWGGNEFGYATYPLWNVVPRDQVTQFAWGKGKTDGHGEVWLPAECPVSLRKGWFWNTQSEPTIKSVDHLMDIYEKSVGRGANLLLNVTPDRRGLIPEPDMKRLKEFGAEVRRRFGKPLAETHGHGNSVELDLPAPSTINGVILQEDIRHGQRVRSYVVEAMLDGQWVAISAGSSIGHEKIESFAPITTSTLRFRTITALADPILTRLAAMHSD